MMERQGTFEDVEQMCCKIIVKIAEGKKGSNVKYNESYSNSTD